MMRMLLAVLIAAAPLAAGDEPGPNDVAKEIQDALGKNEAEAFKAACGRAVEFYGRLGEKKGGALVGAVAKGLDHKEPAIAIAAAETLAKMPSKAGTKALGRLLKVPGDPGGERLPVHKAAIAACGAMAQPDSLKDLEELVGHKDPEIAVAAAEALGRFGSLDAKKLDGLVGRLVKTLGTLEKKVAKSKEPGDVEKVRSAVEAALAKLTGQSHKTAAEWAKWLKESKKKKKPAES